MIDCQMMVNGDSSKPQEYYNVIFNTGVVES